MYVKRGNLLVFLLPIEFTGLHEHKGTYVYNTVCMHNVCMCPVLEYCHYVNVISPLAR